MLLLAHDTGDSVTAEGSERLCGMLQQARPLGGRRRRHGGGQVDQPAGVGGEAAHHLKGGNAVLLAYGHGLGEAGRDDALADGVVEIEVGRL